MSSEHGIARIRESQTTGNDAAVVGLAFLVGRRLLVTCAHVVNAALHRQERDSSAPGDPVLQVEFPFAGREGDLVLRTARLVEWLPASDPGLFFDLDVAALRLDEDPPEGVRILSLHDGDPQGEVRMWGPSEQARLDRKKVSGIVSGHLMGRVDRQRLQVDQVHRGVFRVRKGFSGGPVWHASSGAVVGMVQAVGDDSTDAYVLAVRVLRRVTQSHPVVPDQRKSIRRLAPLVMAAIVVVAAAAWGVMRVWGQPDDFTPAGPAPSISGVRSTPASGSVPVKEMTVNVSNGSRSFDFDNPAILETADDKAPADFRFLSTSDSRFPSVQAMFRVSRFGNGAKYLRLSDGGGSPPAFDSITEEFCVGKSSAMGDEDAYTASGKTLYCLKTAEGRYGAMQIEAGATIHVLELKVRMWR